MLGAWAELACICQFVLQTSPVQTQAQAWVLGHLHDEKSAARSTAQIVSLPMFWAIMSRGTWLQFTFYGSTALCPNDWELWATLNGYIICTKSSKYSVIRDCSTLQPSWCVAHLSVALIDLYSARMGTHIKGCLSGWNLKPKSADTLVNWFLYALRKSVRSAGLWQKFLKRMQRSHFMSRRTVNIAQ